MRFLLLSTDYPEFLDWHYRQHPGLERRPYAEQAQARAASQFNLADFYSRNLHGLGHEAWDIDVNNEFMQKAWARQEGRRVKGEGRWRLRLRRGFVPWPTRQNDDWVYDILGAQIKSYRPDVLLTHWIGLDPVFVREMKPYVRLMVGSHSSPLRGEQDLSVYDLMLSVVDNFVAYFRSRGLKSERLRLGFEPAVLAGTNVPERLIPISFVGRVTGDHASRQRWLDYVCERLPVEIWAPSLDGVSTDSPVTRLHRGPAWGARMFEVMRKSQLTLNHHIDVAEEFAGNVRLFEATGCGALLVTDWKKNLHEMFEPGKEVAAYRTPEECVEMVNYYLTHDTERQVIAQAGQQRTLRNHTFRNRMQELVSIVRKYL
jgi:spore maturation protein CgeB